MSLCWGWGGCLCLSMQFLIFVKINSKSLAPWGVWPPWQSYVSGASGPSSFEPPPPPSSVLRALSQFPNSLLASACAWWLRHWLSLHWVEGAVHGLERSSKPVSGPHCVGGCSVASLTRVVRVSLVRSDAGSLQTAQKVRVLQTASGECLPWPFFAAT